MFSRMLLCEADFKSLERRNVQEKKVKKMRLRYVELLFGGLMSFEHFMGKHHIIVLLQVLRDAIVLALLCFSFTYGDFPLVIIRCTYCGV